METEPEANQRSAERYEVELPITMEGEEGATQNLSSTGMLIESSAAPEIGARVEMTLQYLMDGQDFALACQGEVVRVERRGDGYNIAVRLHQPLFTEAELSYLP